jgi:hypothetical protein
MTKAFVLYVPATMRLLLNTSSIGKPVMSFTLNKLPLRLSVTSSNVPLPPSTLSTLALLPLRYTCSLDTKLLDIGPMPTKADPLSKIGLSVVPKVFEVVYFGILLVMLFAIAVVRVDQLLVNGYVLPVLNVLPPPLALRA